MPEYPPDLELELNIPLWIDFDWNPQYKKQPYEGKTKSGKTPGSPYWRYPVMVGGVKKQWTLWQGQEEVKNAIEIIRQRGEERVAVMKIEEDKKHYYCVSNPGGGLMSCIPNHALPQRFVDFVGVSSNGEGVAPQPSQPQQQSPAVTPLVRKTMVDCLLEACDAWYAALKKAEEIRQQDKSNEAEMLYNNINKAMGECLGMTASSIFNRG